MDAPHRTLVLGLGNPLLRDDSVGLRVVRALQPEHMEPTIGQPPRRIAAATRAVEAGGPSQPFQVVQAVGISPKPGLELAHGPREVRASARRRHHL